VPEPEKLVEYISMSMVIATTGFDSIGELRTLLVKVTIQPFVVVAILGQTPAADDG
jgi:hypothetical protein